MWKFKRFNSFADQVDWINRNDHKYQITVIYVNNGYAVEYRKLRIA